MNKAKQRGTSTRFISFSNLKHLCIIDAINGSLDNIVNIIMSAYLLFGFSSAVKLH